MASQWNAERLPAPVVLAPGSSVTLRDLLTQQFGAAASTITEAWITYLGTDYLEANKFSYWDPTHPSIARWSVSGSDIGADFTNQRYVPSSNFGAAVLTAGNDIAPIAFISIQSSRSGYTANTQYAIQIVDPAVRARDSLQAPVPEDILAAAQRFGSLYTGVPNPTDCGYIVSAITEAAGATMPYECESIDPTKNLEGGFWRIVYRGSDPGTIANWQTLTQPGDVIRTDWADPLQAQHTALVVGPQNANGSITVFDNGYFVPGSPIGRIGPHLAQFEAASDPKSVTLYRLASDHRYLIQRTDQSELIPGTVYDDLIYSGGGDDFVTAASGNDLVYGNLGADLIYGNTGNDILLGGQGLDSLIAGQGNDAVYGNLGDDAIYGNLGNDTLSGGQGADRIFGGQGDDLLSGNLGNDTLSGGLGADRFGFGANGGADLIFGFNQGEGDRLDLGGQGYVAASDGQGGTLLTLSGGGTVDLAGIAPGSIGAAFFA